MFETGASSGHDSSLSEVIDGVYRWSTAEFGQPIGLNLFDQRISEAIDYDWLAENVSKYGILEQELRELLDKGMLKGFPTPGGSAGFLLYTPEQVKTLKALKAMPRYTGCGKTPLMNRSLHETGSAESCYKASMRGNDEQQGAVFSYVSAEQRIAADHPLRRIRAMTDGALKELSPELDRLYASGGRPSIAPEKLLRALLLQVLYSRRSERLLMEEMNYNLLFRWFVGLEMDDGVWDVTVFTKNRERLLAGEISQKFLQAVVKQARTAELLSDEHFTVDGTLIEAWANRRSFVEKPEPPQRGTGARGRKLLRDTHESKTDPEARLFRRSQAGEARPSYLGHVITENRNGLVVAGCVTQSSTKAEREAALAMLPEISNGRGRTTLGADKGYQERAFLERLRSWGVVPHVAEYGGKPRPWLGGLRAEERNDPGFEQSQKKRKRVEQVFGWIKEVAGMRQTKFRGRRRVEWMFRLALSALNLLRMQRLLPATTG